MLSPDSDEYPTNSYATPIGPTFPEFIKFVVESHVHDDHWQPYNLHCSTCLINYDFIIRYEFIYFATHIVISRSLKRVYIKFIRNK